jgi:hypothetical protein
MGTVSREAMAALGRISDAAVCRCLGCDARWEEAVLHGALPRSRDGCPVIRSSWPRPTSMVRFSRGAMFIGVGAIDGCSTVGSASARITRCTRTGSRRRARVQGSSRNHGLALNRAPPRRISRFAYPELIRQSQAITKLTPPPPHTTPPPPPEARAEPPAPAPAPPAPAHAPEPSTHRPAAAARAACRSADG